MASGPEGPAAPYDLAAVAFGVAEQGGADRLVVPERVGLEADAAPPQRREGGREVIDPAGHVADPALIRPRLAGGPTDELQGLARRRPGCAVFREFSPPSILSPTVSPMLSSSRPGCWSSSLGASARPPLRPTEQTITSSAIANMSRKTPRSERPEDPLHNSQLAGGQQLVRLGPERRGDVDFLGGGGQAARQLPSEHCAEHPNSERPPIVRKKITALVAAPRWPHLTTFWTPRM